MKRAYNDFQKAMHPLLSRYIPIANLIVKTFGDDVEVVLHDLRHPQNSVVYVANSHVTGRVIGESFQHLIAKALEAQKADEGILANYYFEQNGRKIRSSTLFIRTDEGDLIGALCINIDTTRVMSQLQWLQTLLPGLSLTLEPQSTPPHGADSKEDSDILQTVNALIDRILEENPNPKNRDERLQLIRFMESRGVFLVKGAMDRVAEKLKMSKVTLYADLDEVRKTQ